jgi:N-carbamoylputrescine amidase
MKVTACELSDNEVSFIEDWQNLKIHLKTFKPDLLLLPEMPFCKWIASEQKVDDTIRMLSIQKHERWIKEIEKLDVKYTVYSKPVMEGDKFFNTAFVYEAGFGHRKIHTKAFFPEEAHFWEETWYDREGVVSFEPLDLDGIKIGVLLCTEMWFTEHARNYGKQGVDILLCPRATGFESVSQWTRCGQTLSVISGAYCLSSNKSGQGDNDFKWGGAGWIIKPMNGNLVGTTSANEKFITKEIDLERSRAAKKEYPLYVKD